MPSKMEFMPQQDELPNVTGGGDNLTETTVLQTAAMEEELVAAIEIGHSNQQAAVAENPPSIFGRESLRMPPPPPPPPQQAPTEPEKPVYFSDGTLYPSELNNPIPSTSTEASTSAISTAGTSNVEGGDMTVALPDNLLEIYNNLGLIGKLLTGGSLVTIKFIQAFRTFGESFVNVLGITKPKYEYELNMAKQMQEAEAARVAKLDQLYSSWQTPPPAQSSQPHPPPMAPTYQGPYGVPAASAAPSAVPLSPPTMQYGSQQPLPPPPSMMMHNNPPPMSSMPSQQQQQYNPVQVLSVQSLPSQSIHQPPPPPATVNLPPFPSPPQLTQAVAAAAAAVNYSTSPFAPPPPPPSQ